MRLTVPAPALRRGRGSDGQASYYRDAKEFAAFKLGIEMAARVADRHAQPTGNDQWELGAAEIARDIRHLATHGEG